MSKPYPSSAKIILLCLAVLLGCEEKELKEIKAVRPPPNLSGIAKRNVPMQGNVENEAARIGSNANVEVGSQLFAFQGDNLYRIHPDTRAVEFYGSGWAGTQSATVMGETWLFAVVANHMWRADMKYGTVEDFGCCWDNTNLLTNDGVGGLVYAIQSQYLLKFPPYTYSHNWTIVGTGDWTGSSDMSFSRYNSARQLFIYWESQVWVVNPTTGTWTGLGVHPNGIIHPYTTDNVLNRTYGIQAGKLVSSTTYPGPYSPTYPNAHLTSLTTAQWSGATDISLVYRNNQYEVFILKNSQIHHLKMTNPITNMTPIPGLNSVYRIVSNNGR